MTSLYVSPATSPLRGRVTVPSDKSIGHRALLLAAIANGQSVVRGYVGGEDTQRSLSAVEALGVRVSAEGDVRTIHGVGLFGLSPPQAEIDCGNSGTTMRLLTGLLAPQPFVTTLVGDASLSRRPMRRILEPLRSRGVVVSGTEHEGEERAPLTLGPTKTAPRALEHTLPMASAQVKSALLLSGLYSDDETCVREPFVSRDHTERLLVAMGAPLSTCGPIVSLNPTGWNRILAPIDFTLPGDLSSASFILAAAWLVPGSDVALAQVGMNPTRMGLLDLARTMGGRWSHTPGEVALLEPVGEIRAWHAGSLRATLVADETVVRSVDEIPVWAALAARARGVSRVLGASELRVKESDRLRAITNMLRAFGIACEEEGDGLWIEGNEGALRGGEVHAGGDHRIAMAAAVLALSASTESVVHDVDAIQTSFPQFVATLRALGATLRIAP